MGGRGVSNFQNGRPAPASQRMGNLQQRTANEIRWLQVFWLILLQFEQYFVSYVWKSQWFQFLLQADFALSLQFKKFRVAETYFGSLGLSVHANWDDEVLQIFRLGSRIILKRRKHNGIHHKQSLKMHLLILICSVQNKPLLWFKTINTFITKWMWWCPNLKIIFLQKSIHTNNIAFHFEIFKILPKKEFHIFWFFDY